MLNKRLWIDLGFSLCFFMTGCGAPEPLVISKKQPDYAPLCGPNRHIKFGQRVVGYVHDGPKHKEFLVDETGKEYDPENIAEQAWSYLEQKGDARKIEDVFSKDGSPSIMPVVSINPVVVILETYPDDSWRKQNRDFAHERWYWRAQIQPNSIPLFRENMKWFSPELKQGPTDLNFSEAGVAEIQLPNGKLKLVRNGDRCKTTRE